MKVEGKYFVFCEVILFLTPMVVVRSLPGSGFEPVSNLPIISFPAHTKLSHHEYFPISSIFPHNVTKIPFSGTHFLLVDL